MKERVVSDNGKRSLRLLGVFAAIVLSLVLISLCIKVVATVQKSTFDGIHRFVLFISDAKGQSRLISFDPSLGNTLMLTLRGISSQKKIIGALALPVDGVVRVPTQLREDESLPTVLISMILDPRTSYAEVTLYDILRLYLLSLHLPARDVRASTLFVKADMHLPDTLKKYFLDRGILTDNQAIAIMNGAGISGLGQQFEGALLLLGANVVSVTTTRLTQEPTYIYYSGKKSYTVNRLERILNQRAEEGDTGVADILVVIGKRSLSNDLFATMKI